MKKVIDLLSDLRAQQIKLVLKGNDLEIISYKGRVSSNQIQQIKSLKENLIVYLKRVESTNTEENTSIPIVDSNNNGYALSNAQRRLWFASQTEDGSSAQNNPDTIVLDGAYHIASFEKAILSAIERHEILRTVFRMNEEGVVRQFILDINELGFSIDHQDFRNHPDAETAWKEYVSNDMHRPFDLSNGPLLRASLLRLSEEKYVFYYNMHHIISDGWSMDVLSQDVMQYYEAYVSDKPSTLKPLRIQYKDYSGWQQEQLKTKAYQEHQAYWQSKFAEEVVALDLPSSKKRPVVKSYNGYRLGSWLSPDITKRLRDYTTTNGGSLFMGLLAIWKVLLYRYTGNSDITIGNPVSGRNHIDLENQIGFYVNTLALRTQLNREESFAAFFDRFKDNMLNAYAHQDYPFDKLLEELNLAGQPGRSPLFDVLVDYHGVSQNAHPFSEEVAYEDLGPSMVKFDLEFDPTEVGGGVNLLFAYNSDVYELEMVSQLVGHYKRLIASLLLDPAQKVGQVSYLSKEETTELLEGYNSSRLDTRFEPTIVDLFADQVSRNPKGIAVRYKELSLSYETLDARSNQLAHYLKKKGVGKDTLVPICVESPLEMIQGILGIVKAGGAYVPIDPNCPEQRLEYILGDIKAEQLLTSTALVEKFEVYEDEMELKCLDEEEWLESNSKQALEEGPSPDQLVYVIYTSGTTGVPKGVLIEHRNLSDYLNGLWKKLGWEEGQSYGLMSTPTADLGNTVLFSALGRGGMLHTFSKEDLMNAHDLNDYFKKHSIDWIKIVPSHWQSLGVGEEILTPKKGIVFGGEVLSVEVIKQIKQNAPDLKVVNHYGPTETTIGKLMHQVDMNEEYEVVPIGLPFSNTAIYILDPNKKLLPKGAVGELYISGAGVARGYLNQEDLTAERFIENPYRVGEKMYGTGDLGKWLPSGEVGFKGRKDNQIKIRGYRVELEEIESVLNQLSNIEKSVVVAYEKEGGSKQLVAYVVSKELVDSKSIKEGLMLVLEEKLPDHMVPEIYVKLEKMPLTSNGKINRKALPVPDIFKQRENYVAPTTELEVQLVKIWQEILGIDRIGINDNFFDLGGNSLNAIKLVTSYYKLAGKRINIKDIFEQPLLKDQALLIERGVKEIISPIEQVEQAESYVLSNAQRRLWLASQVEEGLASYNIPNTNILDGNYDVPNFAKAIHAVIDRHEILRTVFKINDEGEVCQYVMRSDDLNFSIDYKDFRNHPDAETAWKEYVSNDMHRPFDLSNGPLLRASLLRLSEEKYVFYYNMHHIISDGWSMDVLSQDVMQYYEAYVSDKPSTLKPLRIQYKDYSGWQQEQLKTKAYQEHQAYWQSKFAEEVVALDLPSSKKRPVVKSYNGYRLGSWLSPDITKRLRDYTTTNGGSLFMGLLAIWKVLLYRYTGNSDITIGNPVSGRNHIDLENQIGFYVNTLALRTQLNREESFAAFFDRFKDNMLNAYAHQDYPFDKLLEELNLAGQPGRSPLFDVLVDYHGVSQNAHPFNEEVAYEDLGPSMVKFDLEFDPTEVGGGVNLLFAYNSDVYELGMVSKLVGHYKRLIASLLLDPAQKVGQVSYLSKEETTELLEGYNSSRLDTRFEPTIVDLFADQVSRNPKGIAVRYKELSLSYETLDARSNQLAHYLKKKGVGKDTLVPICVESPLEMIQGILGIVKAGGAYVPIDPNCPEQRLEYILGDIKAEQLLTSTALVEKFEVYEDEMELKCLDEEEWLESNSKQALEEGPSPDQLVYVIYTSGTTGVPKGVLIEHRNLSDYLNGLWKKLGWEEGQSYGLMSTPTADLGNTVLFSALGRGGMLHTFSKEDLMNAHDLNDYFKKHSIDWIKIVPSHWQSLGVGEEILTPKKGIVFGGEVLSVEVIKQIKQNAPDLKVVNHYGPTETTIGKLMHQVDMNEEYEVVPIGLPFSNTAIYILDPNKKLLPKGAVGELYISGAGVARGYLNQEDLTAERFIENPYRAGEKMYGTGDLGKWLPSGEVGFKGRKDNQIKIRGYRVELEEIESVLNQLSNIEKSVVVAYEKEGGSKQLVAYVVSKELVDSKSIKEGLMLVLEEKLPDHMVPEIYVKLEKMPLTSNGKINRKALPVPDIFKQRENYVAPTTELEVQLVKIWQEILGIDRIGINDNFFDLGGNSLNAIKINSRIRKELNIGLDIKKLFQLRTVSELAFQIEFSENQEKIKSDNQILRKIEL